MCNLVIVITTMAHGTITRGVDGRKVEPTTTSIGIYTITPSIVSREFNGGWGGGGVS